MGKGLGKGLEALIPVSVSQESTTELARIPIDRIRPNRHQPRLDFGEEEIAELAGSLKRHGLAQPIIVNPPDNSGVYELIAGERRWRAARRAGMTEIPAVIRSAGGRESLVISLVENLQRKNLNPVEASFAYKKLAEDFGLSQQEISTRTGKSRAAIANTLRILELPYEVLEDVKSGRLSEGHARAVASLPDKKQMVELASRIVRESWSVREAEAWVQRFGARRHERRRKGSTVSAELQELKEDLQRILGTKVEINGTVKRGRLILHYFSTDDLEDIAARLKRRTK